MSNKNKHQRRKGIQFPENDCKPDGEKSSSQGPPQRKRNSSKMTTPEQKQKQKLDHNHDVMAAAAVTSAAAGMAVGGPIVSLAAGAAAAELATHEDGAIGGFCRATGQFVIDTLDWLDATTRRMCHDCMS